ncbi:MAG TPA: hypothetical protein VL484_03565 [Vicinamibacterales bacterium]|jgi:hypothetical protein|nr:hypothetical protein [Vicinamibacterales bacterium]
MDSAGCIIGKSLELIYFHALTGRHRDCGHCRPEVVLMFLLILAAIMALLSFFYVKKRRTRKAAH